MMSGQLGGHVRMKNPRTKAQQPWKLAPKTARTAMQECGNMAISQMRRQQPRLPKPNVALSRLESCAVSRGQVRVVEAGRREACVISNMKV